MQVGSFKIADNSILYAIIQNKARISKIAQTIDYQTKQNINT